MENQEELVVLRKRERRIRDELLLLQRKTLTGSRKDGIREYREIEGLRHSLQETIEQIRQVPNELASIPQELSKPFQHPDD